MEFFEGTIIALCISIDPGLIGQAPDAVYVDSTGLSIEEVEETILRLVRARISNGKEFR